MFEKHYASVCRIARSFTIPGYDPQDLEQEAVVILLEMTDHSKADDAGYIAMSTRNKLIDLQRRANFLPTVSLDEPISGNEEGFTLGDTVASGEPSAEEILIEAELLDAIRCAVNSMPREMDRKVVSIRCGIGQSDEAGRSLRETAKVLSISRDRAGRAWRRGLDYLRNNQQLLEAA